MTLYLMTCFLVPLLVSIADVVLLNSNPSSWLNRAVAYYKGKFSNEVKQMSPVQINVTIVPAPPGYVDSPLWDSDDAVRLLTLIEQSEEATEVRRKLRRALQPYRRFMSIKQSRIHFPSLLKHYVNDFYYDTDEDSEEAEENKHDKEVIYIRNPLESRLPGYYVSIQMLRDLLENRAIQARSMPTTNRTFAWDDISNKYQQNQTKSTSSRPELQTKQKVMQPNALNRALGVEKELWNRKSARFSAESAEVAALIDLYRGHSKMFLTTEQLRIVSRIDWLAQPPNDEIPPLKHPIPLVIIAHTVTEGCSTQNECVLSVRLIQDHHVTLLKWSDIGYSFLVGGDGAVYMGRGWDSVGSHTKGYNELSIGIGFVGNFTMHEPPQIQLDACKKLIQLGVEKGKLSKDYKLVAHSQLQASDSPETKLAEIIKSWPHTVADVTNIKDTLHQQDSIK